MTFIDTLEASQALIDAGFEEKKAKAIVKAISPTHDSLVTKDMLSAVMNKLKAELIIWMIGLQIASVSLIVTLLDK